VPTAPHPLTGQQLSLTLGHEFSGVITDVGEGVVGWSEADRVAVEPIYKRGPVPSVLRRQLQHLRPDRLPRPDVRRRDGTPGASAVGVAV